MARQDTPTKDAPTGFDGGLTGLGLPDLVQIAAQNRFSGCFRLEHEDQLGLLFLHEGQIVHAEVGSTTGEDAFRELLTWPRGRFTTEPNVVTTQRSIQKSREHLLLDAHRWLDEQGVLEQRDVMTSQDETPAGPGTKRAVEAVRSLPGVAAAVLLTRDGQLIDGPYELDALAGQSAYLAMLAADVGALFRAGELRSATVQGFLSHLLLYPGKAHLLGVAARPEEDLRAVDGAVRRALLQGR